MASSKHTNGDSDEHTALLSNQRSNIDRDQERGLLQAPRLNDSSNGAATAAVQDPESTEETVLVDETANNHIFITLASIYVGVFLGALDATIIATLSAPISTSFNSLSLLSWLASGYLIANAACQPLSGRLTDIFGRRAGLITSNILFAAGNLICGLAQSEGVMIAGRVVAGMGGGGLMAISTFVASDLVPLRKRGVIQGVGNVCFGLGAGLGGLVGGWINDTWGWRVAFLAQVPLVTASGVLVAIMVKIPAKKSAESKLSRVDFVGAFTLLVALVLLLLGLNSGGNIVPWTHPLVIVSLSLSPVFLAGFTYFEAYKAKEPVIPVRLLLNRTVAAACLTNWFSTMAIFMIIFYIPIFFQVKGFTTTQAGIRLIPQSLGSSVASLGSGLIMNRTGKYKLLSHAALTTFVIGIGATCTLALNEDDWLAFIYLFLIGAGYGAMLTVALLATLSAVAHEHQAVITSATYAFRSTGSSIGVTIASAVYQNVLKSQLYARFGDRDGAADVIRRIRDNLDELKHLPEGWTEGVMLCYGEALSGVFYSALVLGVVSLVCNAFMRQNVLHSNLARTSQTLQD